MQVILDSLFACLGSALIWGGKKGEFRDWTIFKVAENSFQYFSRLVSLMGHYNHSILVDANIMVSTNCPIIGEQVAVNFVAQ